MLEHTPSVWNGFLLPQEAAELVQPPRPRLGAGISPFGVRVGYTRNHYHWHARLLLEDGEFFCYRSDTASNSLT